MLGSPPFDSLTHCLTVRASMSGHAVLTGLAQCISRYHTVDQAAIQGGMCDSAKTGGEIGIRHTPVSGNVLDCGIDSPELDCSLTVKGVSDWAVTLRKYVHDVQICTGTRLVLPAAMLH